MSKKIMKAIIISLIFSWGVFTKDYFQIIPLNIGYFIPDTIDYIRRKASKKIADLKNKHELELKLNTKAERLNNENLSKKLCEICGIPYEKEIDNELYISMRNNGDPRCTQISKKNRATLNFEQPENFVKLLEIVYKKSLYTGTRIGSFRNTKKSFKECFFQRLFARLNKLGNCFAGKELKQAIKAQKWSYE